MTAEWLQPTIKMAYGIVTGQALIPPNSKPRLSSPPRLPSKSARRIRAKFDAIFRIICPSNGSSNPLPALAGICDSASLNKPGQ